MDKRKCLRVQQIIMLIHENNVVSIRFAQKDAVFFINSLPTAENFG